MKGSELKGVNHSNLNQMLSANLLSTPKRTTKTSNESHQWDPAPMRKSNSCPRNMYSTLQYTSQYTIQYLRAEAVSYPNTYYLPHPNGTTSYPREPKVTPHIQTPWHSGSYVLCFFLHCILKLCSSLALSMCGIDHYEHL